MPVIICRVMCQCPQRESIFIEIRRIPQQRLHEVTSAHVMQQIAEEVAAKRVVAQILNHRPAVGVRVRFLQLFSRGIGEAL